MWKTEDVFPSFFTRCRCAIKFTLRLFYPRRNSHWFPLYRRLGGLKSRFGRCAAEKNILPLPGIEHQPCNPSLTNQNITHEEIKSRLNLRNIYFHSLRNLLSYHLISKTIKVNNKRTPTNIIHCKLNVLKSNLFFSCNMSWNLLMLICYYIRKLGVPCSLNELEVAIY
jgi:hypothetical protein